ncbi:hypothetical protein ACFH4J_003470 [Escherichia coli]
MQHESRRSVTRRVSKTIMEIFKALIFMSMFIGGMVFFVNKIEPGLAQWAHGFTNSAIPILLGITLIIYVLLAIAFLYLFEDGEGQFLTKRGYQYLICALGLGNIFSLYITKNLNVDTLNISLIYLLFFNFSRAFFGLFLLTWAIFSLTLFRSKEVEKQS